MAKKQATYKTKIRNYDGGLKPENFALPQTVNLWLNVW